jgi:hypothetical protein
MGPRILVFLVVALSQVCTIPALTDEADCKFLYKLLSSCFLVLVNYWEHASCLRTLLIQISINCSCLTDTMLKYRLMTPDSTFVNSQMFVCLFVVQLIA